MQDAGFGLPRIPLTRRWMNSPGSGFIADSSPLAMLPLTRRTRTKKRRKENAVMAPTRKDALMEPERTRAVLKYIQSLLKEPYDDELKDPLRDPDKAFGKLEEDRYRAELELVDRYQSFVAELLRLSLLGYCSLRIPLQNHF